MDIQEQLFQRLEENYDHRPDLIRDLESVLFLKRDAIYRRLRGETALTANEMGLICKKYGISVDAIVQDDASRMFFEFSAFKSPIKSVDQYVEQLDQNFQKIRSIPEGKIYYATSEIPVFYYAFFPRLFLFKLYVWGKTVWDIQAYKDLPFSFDIIPYNVKKKSQELISGYTQISTVELWSLNIIDNTMNQIFYHAEIEAFKDLNDALILCDDMDLLLDHLETMIASEKKSLPESPTERADIKVYHNEMIYTNNTIYFKSPSLRMLYTTLANPNFINTQNKDLCDYKEKWYEQLISKSSLLSGPGEKRRSKFFSTLHKTVHRTREKIEIMIDR